MEDNTVSTAGNDRRRDSAEWRGAVSSRRVQSPVSSGQEPSHCRLPSCLLGAVRAIVTTLLQLYIIPLLNGWRSHSHQSLLSVFQRCPMDRDGESVPTNAILTYRRIVSYAPVPTVHTQLHNVGSLV